MTETGCDEMDGRVLSAIADVEVRQPVADPREVDNAPKHFSSELGTNYGDGLSSTQGRQRWRREMFERWQTINRILSYNTCVCSPASALVLLFALPIVTAA